LDVKVKDFAFLDYDLDAGEIKGNVYAKVLKGRGSTYGTGQTSQ